MLIKTSALKKLMKEAAKEKCLHVWMLDGCLKISGTHWAAEIDPMILTARDKGMIIEIVDEFPKKGTGVRIEKDQIVQDAEVPNLIEKLRPEEELEVLHETLFTIEENKVLQAVFDRSKLYLCDNFIVEATHDPKLNYKVGDDLPEVIQTDGRLVYWMSNYMTLAVEKTIPLQEWSSALKNLEKEELPWRRLG